VTENLSWKLLEITQITGKPVITGKQEKFHHYKFGQDSDANDRLALFSIVFTKKIVLEWVGLKK
jgi:hypothetical protein